MSRLAVAAFVLLASVGGLLGVASWNRGGTATSLVLTERELSLPWDWPPATGEARELRLAFRWHSRDEPQDARLWLTDIRLRELGFSTGVPAGAPEAEGFYGRSLPRTAWVAFEYDGPAWRQIERRLVLGTSGTDAARKSRLVPIDAGLDPDVLRRRHDQGRVLVLPAVIGMRADIHPTRGPSVWAMVEHLAVGAVTVPRHLRERLRPLSPHRERGRPRYEVTLGVGRLGLAWVQDVRMASIDD